MKKTTIVAFLIVLILSGACTPVQSTYSCLGSERTAINNPHFQLLWSRSKIVIRPGSADTLMQGIASKAFVITGQDLEYGGSKLLALDALSGNVLWQRDVRLPGSIITSNSQLYAGLYDKLEIVDPQTGNLVKEIRFSKVGSIYNIFATEHNLYALTNSGRWLTYNLEDGTYSLSEPFLPYTPFLIEDGILYFKEFGTYKAKDTETQSILWEYLLNEATHVHPLITENMIIVLAERGSIYGLDKSTGDLLWKLDEPVISNVISNKSQLYFLTNDGYLKVLDINSGQEITKLEFTPASFELDSPPSGNIIGAYDIWVDSENDTLIMSFGDSCQLMAFKLAIP